jgi:tRNA (guanine-N7-)-methyltransferase
VAIEGETWLEIGFGGGEHMAQQAARHPEVSLIGAEPFLNGLRPRCGTSTRAP